MHSTTYIAFLRGINVGGHSVKMERLRQIFVDAGCAQVRSYIQSGNIFFETDQTDRAALRLLLERQLKDALGFTVPVALRTLPELEEMLSLNPFAGITLTSEVRFAVTFLVEPVANLIPVPYLTPDGAYELRTMTPTELFVVWHLRDGRPGNSYGALEKQLAVPGTTRFWHTTEKLLAAARGAKK